MTYELAKKLKDAGYKMDYNLDGFSEYDKKTAHIDIPLNELIEACGDRFEELIRIGHGIKPKWSAVSYSCEECNWQEMETGRGATAEEAVANLWLALNKK